MPGHCGFVRLSAKRRSKTIYSFQRWDGTIPGARDRTKCGRQFCERRTGKAAGIRTAGQIGQQPPVFISNSGTASMFEITGSACPIIIPWGRRRTSNSSCPSKRAGTIISGRDRLRAIIVLANTPANLLLRPIPLVPTNAAPYHC